MCWRLSATDARPDPVRQDLRASRPELRVAWISRGRLSNSDPLADTLDVRRKREALWTHYSRGLVTGVHHAGWTHLANCGTWSGALRTASCPTRV